MLAAFGSGVEKIIGAKKMFLLMLGCGIVSAFAHFAVYPSSIIPVIGASGAISGLFAAMIAIIAASGAVRTGKNGIIPVVLIWVVITVVFSLWKYDFRTGATGD
jgi:membrane associated rhomboid family serine protease